FENTAVPDLTAFREIALDIQAYTGKYVIDPALNSISAVYLHLDLGHTPSLAAQRNFRALWHLKNLLNLASLSLCVISPNVSKETPDLSHHFALRNMSDFKIWRDHLAHPRALTMSQFIKLVLGQQQNCVYAAPAEPLTKDMLSRKFCQVETEYFKMLQEDRTGLIGHLDKVQDERQKSHNETQATRQELEDLTVQHNSLLQQLNLRDNTEIRDITHQFRGLNDEIDEISLEVGRAIADDLYKRYPDCEKCHNPAGLRQCLGGPNTPLLLLQSSKGDPVETRQFLELYAGSVCEAFNVVYRELRLRDPQIMCAKWRVDTYSTLFRLGSARRKEVTDRISSHITAMIMAACGHLFGDRVKPPADNTRLTQLVARALKLNDRIKQEVVHAGDIHTEHFQYNEPYNDLKMKVLDADERDPLPTHIVSTCGLGAGFTKAVGGGKEPESSTLLKAIVASEQIYG
ncbi:hypothetical protein FRC06_005648, partial [Ceratobasidium sp. 370]